jgi:hypothetical protein
VATVREATATDADAIRESGCGELFAILRPPRTAVLVELRYRKPL